LWLRSSTAVRLVASPPQEQEDHAHTLLQHAGAGQPTACVLHLNRAMEIAIHRLAKKLKVPVDAKDNMGSMLGAMTDPIKKLPDRKPSEKRKKELWAECRTNLYHVKMAWRDPAHHGKQSYDDTQARDIMDRVRGFMQQLATLL
jgi:hypothetical protein